MMEEEIWKEINIANRVYYVSNMGNVKNSKGMLMSQRTSKDGYKLVRIWFPRENPKVGQRKWKGKQILVHRLVAKAFIPDPNNLSDVNHINFNRVDNRVCNLEWISHTDNVKYSYKHDRHKGRQIGEKNSKARLTEEQVIDIRRKYDSGEMTQMELAKEYNVGWSTIHNIVFRLTWKHI